MRGWAREGESEREKKEKSERERERASSRGIINLKPELTSTASRDFFIFFPVHGEEGKGRVWHCTEGINLANFPRNFQTFFLFFFLWLLREIILETKMLRLLHHAYEYHNEIIKKKEKWLGDDSKERFFSLILIVIRKNGKYKTVRFLFSFLILPVDFAFRNT